MTTTATEAAELVRGGKTTARELTAATLARIEAVNPALNAVVELRRDQALAEADAHDERGDHSGLLGGVPVTIKESLHVAGLHSTWGNEGLRDYIAGEDAVVVRRLREAGAIVVGTTNVAAMLADFGQSANPVYGATNNPWDPSRTPGGSSGGAAAAIAAGLSFVEFGSDLAGSVRIPASFCGVYGLRPTPGTVPLRGLQPGDAPPLPDHLTYLGAIGPIARSAADLRLALHVTGGLEQPEAAAFTWSLPAPRHTRLADFRVGVVLDHELSPVTGEVGALLSDTVDTLARAGATVVEGWPAGFDPASALRTFGFHLGLFFAFQQPDQRSPALTEMMGQEYQRQAIRAAWRAYFGDVDVLLMPTNFTAAFPHDSRPYDDRTIPTTEGDRPYGDQAFWISHASLAGLPAVSAPIGLTPQGLPVGGQIVAPHHEDDTAITFAELLAHEIGGYRPPPTTE
jgi:amidase